MRVAEWPQQINPRPYGQKCEQAPQGAKNGLTARNKKNENRELTMKAKSRSFDISDTGNLSGSVAQKATPELALCQTQGVRNHAVIAWFCLFRPRLGRAYGFGRMGPRKRAVPCDGSANPVRPARHFSAWRVGFITQDHKETCHV